MNFDEAVEQYLPKHWADTYQQLIKEALIVSHGVDHLLKRIYTSELKPYILKNQFDPNPLTTNTKYGKPVVLNLYLKDGYPKQTLIDLLNFSGYFIAREVEDKKNDYVDLLIEPTKPSQLSEKTLNKIPFFYHITPKTNISKIKEKGLNPKISQTTYKHPADRVYLFYTEGNNQIIESWKRTLAKSKGLETKDMIVLKIKKDTESKYYLDENASSIEYNLLALFTFKSIHPDDIEILAL